MRNETKWVNEWEGTKEAKIEKECCRGKRMDALAKQRIKESGAEAKKARKRERVCVSLLCAKDTTQLGVCPVDIFCDT